MLQVSVRNKENINQYMRLYGASRFFFFHCASPLITKCAGIAKFQ